MKVPFQSQYELINSIKNTESTVHHFNVWWLGQSGFLIKYHQRYLLFDPYLSDSLTVKYLETNKPHTRISELVISPSLLDMIDVVTSSHNHTDHLDAETLKPILTLNLDIQMIIPEANRDFVANRLGCTKDFMIGLNDNESVKIGNFEIIGVPAAHNELERDASGHLKCMGFVVKFGAFSVYHSGDTLWYEGMVDVLKPFAVDVAFLPINGNVPSRGVAGNLNCEEAARLGKAIDAKLVIPHHYDLFEFNTANPDDFVAECKKTGTPYQILALGEGITIRY